MSSASSSTARTGRVAKSWVTRTAVTATSATNAASSRATHARAAPVASGWSGCRVGLAPTGKRRLLTAHTLSGHSRSRKAARGNRGADVRAAESPFLNQSERLPAAHEEQVPERVSAWMAKIGISRKRTHWERRIWLQRLQRHGLRSPKTRTSLAAPKPRRETEFCGQRLECGRAAGIRFADRESPRLPTGIARVSLPETASV